MRHGHTAVLVEDGRVDLLAKAALSLQQPSAEDGGDADASSEQEDDDGGAPDASQEDGGKDADASQQEERDAGEEDDAGTPPPQGGRPQEASTRPEQIERREAEELLDALRRNEKQFLMYQQKGKVKSRVDPEKDW